MEIVTNVFFKGNFYLILINFVQLEDRDKD